MARRDAELHWRCDSGPQALSALLQDRAAALAPQSGPAGWAFSEDDRLLGVGLRARQTGRMVHWTATEASAVASSEPGEVVALADLVADPAAERVEIQTGTDPTESASFDADTLRRPHRRVCEAGAWDIDAPFGPYRIDPGIVPANGQPRLGNFTLSAEIARRFGLTSIFGGGGARR